MGLAGGVVPVVEDLQVEHADHQGDEDGLGGAAVGEASFGFCQVDAVAFHAAVDAFVVYLELCGAVAP